MPGFTERVQRILRSVSGSCTIRAKVAHREYNLENPCVSLHQSASEGTDEGDIEVCEGKPRKDEIGSLWSDKSRSRHK